MVRVMADATASATRPPRRVGAKLDRQWLCTRLTGAPQEWLARTR